MATAAVDGAFQVVYLVVNTICNLTTQHEQVACFENAARHLEPGGTFAIEVGVPDPRGLPPGQDQQVFRLEQDRRGIDEFDVANQASSRTTSARTTASCPAIRSRSATCGRPSSI